MSLKYRKEGGRMVPFPRAYFTYYRGEKACLAQSDITFGFYCNATNFTAYQLSAFLPRNVNPP
jgi:hypothetical protein